MTRDEVEEEVEEARMLLRHGHPLHAALRLQHAVEETSDPPLLHEIQQLGEEGLEAASVIERPNWTKVIAEAEQRDRSGRGE